MYAVVYVPLLLSMRGEAAGAVVKDVIQKLLAHGCCSALVDMWETIATWYEGAGDEVSSDTGTLLLNLFGYYLCEYMRRLYAVPCEIPYRYVDRDDDKEIITDAYMDDEDPSHGTDTTTSTAFPVATASVSRLTSTYTIPVSSFL